MFDDANETFRHIFLPEGKVFMDQPGKVANPARGQLNRENEHSPIPGRA